MSLLVNLRHLDAHNVHLQGEFSLAELDIDPKDELIKVAQPLEYDLEVQKLDDGLLVQGRLRLGLRCLCARCLKAFDYELELKPWTSHLALQGDESVPVVNDCVDLTPRLREDILLEFPQHPLCNKDCSGLRNGSIGMSNTSSGKGTLEQGSPAWKALNKLKF